MLTTLEKCAYVYTQYYTKIKSIKINKYSFNPNTEMDIFYSINIINKSL